MAFFLNFLARASSTSTFIVSVICPHPPNVHYSSELKELGLIETAGSLIGLVGIITGILPDVVGVFAGFVIGLGFGVVLLQYDKFAVAVSAVRREDSMVGDHAYVACMEVGYGVSDDNWGHRRPVWVGLLVVVVVLIFVMSAVFYVLRPIGRAYFPFMGYYPFFFPFGWVFGFLILFFLLRWLFLPWGWGHRGRYRGYRDEYHILRVRYARGEITKDQFDQMTRNLQESNQKTQKTS